MPPQPLGLGFRVRVSVCVLLFVLLLVGLPATQERAATRDSIVGGGGGGELKCST